jgi:hypothetical protein
MFQFFDHPKQSDQSSSTDETIPQQSSSKDEASSSKTSSRRRKNTSKTSSKGSSHRANAASPEINDPPSPKDKMEEESLDDPSIMDEEKHDKVSSDNTTTAMPSEGSSEDEFKVLSASEFLVTAGLSNEECGSATADIAPATDLSSSAPVAFEPPVWGSLEITKVVIPGVQSPQREFNAIVNLQTPVSARRHTLVLSSH